MGGIVRSRALAWADVVVEGTFFAMQKYLTNVGKLSFFDAAAFLNIWGGIYRILPLFFVLCVRKRSSRLNFNMQTVSGIFSASGLVMITYTTRPGYRCHEKGEAECVTRKEKALFITGMALVGVGRATRFAFSPLPTDDETQPSLQNTCEQYCSGLTLPGKIIAYLRWMLVIFFFVTPALAIFTFPYVKEWYFLFGVSAICMVIATVSHLSMFFTYEQPVSEDPVRVIKQALKKLLLPCIFQEEEEMTPADALQLEEIFSIGNIAFGTVVVYSSCIVCGMVSSIGNTYFVQQATHMNYNIGEWKPPLQLLQLIFHAHKLYFFEYFKAIVSSLPMGPEWNSLYAIFYSVVCCAVAAAVERRSVHAVRRHGLVDKPHDVKSPMSAFWLLFQIVFLGIVEAYMGQGLSEFHKAEKAPSWMKRYGDYLGEAMSGLGYMCGALSVYVVGKISETGGGKGWFQPTLNRSRLDRYYWVLAAFTAVYLVVFIVGLSIQKYIELESEDMMVVRHKASERECRETKLDVDP